MTKFSLPILIVIFLYVVVPSSKKAFSKERLENKTMKLETLVKISKLILVVQANGNIHSAFPPKDEFDGTAFKILKILKGAAFLKKAEKDLYFIHRGPACQNDYSPSKSMKELFSLLKYGDHAPNGIVFADRESNGRFQLVCPNAFESIDRIQEIKNLIKSKK